VIKPSISVTCAPVCSHSITFARGVIVRHEKYKSCQHRRGPRKPPAHPPITCDGTASFVAPNSLAIENRRRHAARFETLVGFWPSSLMKSRLSPQLCSQPRCVHERRESSPEVDDVLVVLNGQDLAITPKIGARVAKLSFVKETAARFKIVRTSNGFPAIPCRVLQPSCLVSEAGMRAHSRWVTFIVFL